MAGINYQNPHFIPPNQRLVNPFCPYPAPTLHLVSHNFQPKPPMPAYKLSVNGKTSSVEADEQMPLLWVIRDLIGLTGTKYGCGIAQCGACTVHVSGAPVRSCSFPVSAVGEQPVMTIEGLSDDNSHPVQRAWIAEQVPQCGYCQSGQIMSAVALLAGNANPDDEAINAAMNGNICRCGTYPRIRKAIKTAATCSH
jgi:isoquinoline 1-oxidoreductase subunit alpha